MRTLVELRDSQVDALKRLSERTQASRAELIRRAVDAYLQKQEATERSEGLRAAFGCWAGPSPDALDIEDAVRREWDRE